MQSIMAKPSNGIARIRKMAPELGVYLNKSYYDNLKISEDKFFNFDNAPTLKYCTVIRDSANLWFKIAAKEHFKVLKPSFFNEKATAPFLVIMEMDPDAITPFTLLHESLHEAMQIPLESSYQNKVYLNTNAQVFKQLNILSMKTELPELIFTISLRHIILREGQSRVKYLLDAVDEKAPCQPGAPKKAKKSLVNHELEPRVVPADAEEEAIFRALE